jgi:hypothetical protein
MKIGLSCCGIIWMASAAPNQLMRGAWPVLTPHKNIAVNKLTRE